MIKNINNMEEKHYTPLFLINDPAKKLKEL